MATLLRSTLLIITTLINIPTSRSTHSHHGGLESGSIETVEAAQPPADHLTAHAMNSATEVFKIPELLELILLSLPHDNIHREISSIRIILLGQTTCRTWHQLIKHSTPIRKRLYLPTPADTSGSKTWQVKHAFPPAQPNPWIPHLLLNQRSWGSADPFDSYYNSPFDLHPSQPKHWTFSFEISRAQYKRLPGRGQWRSMLVASPPFTDFWYTRCSYELGSGRAPFVTHQDYNPSLPKCKQRYRVHSDQGVTLGEICDAVTELFEGDAEARSVMAENLRMQRVEEVVLSEDRPLTKAYVPGSSAETAHGWQRGYWGD